MDLSVVEKSGKSEQRFKNVDTRKQNARKVDLNKNFIQKAKGSVHKWTQIKLKSDFKKWIHKGCKNIGSHSWIRKVKEKTVFEKVDSRKWTKKQIEKRKEQIKAKLE